MMRSLLIGAVQAYRLLLGSWMSPSCRFYPSCSGYAIEALQRHGALAGSYLAARRIGRCGPWCEGGDDPVPATAWPRRAPSATVESEAAIPTAVTPDNPPRLFTSLVPATRPISPSLSPKKNS